MYRNVNSIIVVLQILAFNEVLKILIEINHKIINLILLYRLATPSPLTFIII